MFLQTRRFFCKKSWYHVPETFVPLTRDQIVAKFGSVVLRNHDKKVSGESLIELHRYLHGASAEQREHVWKILEGLAGK